MCLRGVVDPASLRIDRIVAEQPSVAFEANALTRGESCRDPIERITALAGTLFDGDYSTRLSAAIGGSRGCSHVLTLAHLIGSTVPWAVAADRAQHGIARVRTTGERVFRRDVLLDGADRGDGSLSLSVQLSDLLWAPRRADRGADAALRFASRDPAGSLRRPQDFQSRRHRGRPAPPRYRESDRRSMGRSRVAHQRPRRHVPAARCHALSSSNALRHTRPNGRCSTRCSWSRRP